MSLINKLKVSINICYLIDVSPKRFIGGGQSHVVSMVREFKRSDLVKRSDIFIFSGLSPNSFVRVFWVLCVIPQVIFHHNFRQRFDLIHAHSIPAMISGKILSLILKIPIVVTIHGAWMKSWLERCVLTRVAYDVQITVSRDFLQHENVNKNIVYIPNGVDTEVFKGRTFREKNMILFVGRKDDPVKGFKFLQSAMQLVKDEIPDTKLTVAGGDISRQEVIKLYKQAHLFVLPSLSEGFPLTLLEAWAARLPVVATAVGDIPYLFNAGKQLEVYPAKQDPVLQGETSKGYLVEPGNAGTLAKAILSALQNPDLAKLGENGYNLAKGYSWKKVAQKTQAVYQRICSTSWRAPMTKR